jgi:cytochrome b
MARTLVFDLPTRIFHWFFAVFFLSAFIIAKNIDTELPLFSLHSMMGLSLVLIVLLRIVWGIFGSRYARFRHFELRPSALIQYFKGVLTSKDNRTLGHNPASAWAGVIMMALAIGLGVTGVLMAQSIDKEVYEEIHDLLANAFIVVAGLHVAGTVLHTIKHRDAIGLSMLDGRKQHVAGQMGISSSHPVIALIFVMIVAGFGVYMNRSYNSTTGVLNLFGKTLQIGESSEDSQGKIENKNGYENEDHD